MRSRMIQGAPSIRRDPIHALDDVEGPGDLAAKRRRRLCRIEDHGLDQFAWHQCRLIGAHGPASMDCCDDVHALRSMSRAFRDAIIRQSYPGPPLTLGRSAACCLWPLGCRWPETCWCIRDG